MDNFPVVKTNAIEIKGKSKNGKIKVVKYDRSFLSLIIQNNKAKGFYADLKNYFLSFEKVKARTAWGAENFMVGSEAIVRMIVRGGALCVLLALDPNGYSQKDYPHLDYSDDKDYRSTPFFLPVRNAAEFKIARRMAAEAFTLRCVYTVDFPARTDYVSALPMQKDDALVKKGFIKKSESEMSEADAKKAIAAAIQAEAEEEKEFEFFDNKKPAKKKEQPAEEPDAIERSDEEDTLYEVGGDGVLTTVYFDRSFTARIIQNEKAKHYYGEIKNFALSFGLKSRRVKSRISWRADRFYFGRTQYFYAKVRGKTLCLYLALDPAAYKNSIYHQIDVSDRKCYLKTPMMIRIKSDLGLKRARRLIAEMLTAGGLEGKELMAVDYAAMYPYEETEPLIERKLIKRVVGKPWEIPKKEAEPEEVELELAEEPEEIAEEPAQEPAEEVAPVPVAEEPTEEFAEEITEEPEEEDEIEDVDFELAESDDAEEAETDQEDEEDEDVEDVEFELAADEEDDVEEVAFELADEGSDDEAEDVSFELAEEEPLTDDESGMEAYGTEEHAGRYVTLKKYVRGFVAKMRQGDQARKDYYARIKAKLLSFKGMKLSESFAGDTFKKGSRALVKSRIRGKTLCLFFALNVDNYKESVYHQKYKGDVKSYATTPMMIRVKSELGMKRALRLIGELERNYVLTAGDHVSTRDVRETFLYEETAALVEKGLIKTKLVTVTEDEARELLKKKG